MKRLISWCEKNLANLITVSGVISAFLFLRTAILEPDNVLEQIIYALITAMTDFLDGKVARWTNSTSVFGSYIDRIRDSIFIYPGIIILGWQHREKIVLLKLLFPLALASVAYGAMIFRIGFIGHSYYRKGYDIEENLKSNPAGQKKTFAGFSIIILFLISLYLECQGITVLKYSMWLVFLGSGLMAYWSHISWQEYSELERDLRKKYAQGRIPFRNKAQ